MATISILLWPDGGDVSTAVPTAEVPTAEVPTAEVPTTSAGSPAPAGEVGATDPAGDVVGIAISDRDAEGHRTPEVTVVNNAEVSSTYRIELAVTGVDDRTIATSRVEIREVEPGEVVTANGTPVTADLPADAVLGVTEVTRTA